jgi:chromosome segregation ATPase
MSNENYLNYYIEILTGTMNDAILRNISLQAQAKVTEGVIGEQTKRIEELSLFIEKLKSETNEAIEHNENDIKSHVDSLNGTIQSLRNELSHLQNMRGEYESVKHQVQHVDTFRNELEKEREEHQNTRSSYDLIIKQLNEKIEYLQLTPAKRNKIDDMNKPKELFITGIQKVESPIDQLLEEPTKDGGSF